MRHTHSDRLERWLGADAVGRLSFAMRNWYGPPIALHGVPGRVYAARGGDFVGAIEAGQECSAIDRALDLLTRNRRFGIARSRRQSGAFASLDAIAAAYTGGKGENAFFNKPGTAANAIGNCISLWKVAGLPAAGAAGAAAPGGTVPTNATTGSLQFANPTNANTTHFTTGYATASVVNTLLLYDRLFSVAKTMNSTATEAVTGVPTRYQSTTATNEDYIGGNFMCSPKSAPCCRRQRTTGDDAVHRPRRHRAVYSVDCGHQRRHSEQRRSRRIQLVHAVGSR
jgi:hypothetical protein